MIWWPYGAILAVMLAMFASLVAPPGIAEWLGPLLALYAVYVAVTGATGL